VGKSQSLSGGSSTNRARTPEERSSNCPAQKGSGGGKYPERRLNTGSKEARVKKKWEIHTRGGQNRVIYGERAEGVDEWSTKEFLMEKKKKTRKAKGVRLNEPITAERKKGQKRSPEGQTKTCAPITMQMKVRRQRVLRQHSKRRMKKKIRVIRPLKQRTNASNLGMSGEQARHTRRKEAVPPALGRHKVCELDHWDTQGTQHKPPKSNVLQLGDSEQVVLECQKRPIAGG